MHREGEGSRREQQEWEGHRGGGGNTGGEAAEGDPFTLSSDPRYHEEAQTPPRPAPGGPAQLWSLAGPQGRGEERADLREERGQDSLMPL